MKKDKYRTSFYLGLVALAVTSVVGEDLAAISPEVRISTFTEEITSQSSYPLPEDWSVRVWKGTPEIEIIKERNGTVLRLRSHQSNVALYKTLDVDLVQFPNLSWKWKVTELPVHGDARDAERDDQAAGIYVIFPRFPGFLNTRIIGYLWESDAPEGTIVRSQNDSRIHYVVVRSGKLKVGKWVQEMRNVGQDYERIFGEKATTVGGVSLMIDSDHTRSSSESFFGEINFSSMPSLRMVQTK